MTAGELGRKRNCGLDRVNQLLGRADPPAAACAHDGARDLARIALLAVLPQDPDQPALVPFVDDVLRGQILVGVHPHVEWRVVRVGEATRPRIDLHRGHAQVHVEQVRLGALLAQLVQRRGEVGPDEPRLARDLGLQLGKSLLGHRIPVDADQRPSRSDPLRDQPRVPAAPHGAVDRDLAGLGVEHRDQLAGQHGDVSLGHVKKCRQDSLPGRECGSAGRRRTRRSGRGRISPSTRPTPAR